MSNAWFKTGWMFVSVIFFVLFIALYVADWTPSPRIVAATAIMAMAVAAAARAAQY